MLSYFLAGLKVAHDDARQCRMLHSAEAKLLLKRRQARITLLPCRAMPCHADQRSEEISRFLFGKAPIKEDCHVAATLLLLCFSLLFCLFMFVCAWFATFL